MQDANDKVNPEIVDSDFENLDEESLEDLKDIELVKKLMVPPTTADIIKEKFAQL